MQEPKTQPEKEKPPVPVKDFGPVILSSASVVGGGAVAAKLVVAGLWPLAIPVLILAAFLYRKASKAAKKQA